MQAKLLTLCMALCAVCLSATSQNVPDYVPTDGLVAWYPFNGNANDESGNGNDGEVTGAISHEDRFGNSSSALAFDGNEDDVRMSSPQLDTVFSGFNAVTMSIWVFGSPESVDGEHRNLMGKGFHCLQPTVRLDKITSKCE
jgi:hypothetical protein